MKISICIPTWEQYGLGGKFLEHLLLSILSQDFNDFDVIISDHSIDKTIENICDGYKQKLDLIYIKNEIKRGNGPANTNNAIKSCNGDIIKIMFQDDFFFDTNALKIIQKKFETENCGWVVNGCNHTSDDAKSFYNLMIPKWNDRIIFGVNTISSPSVLSFKNTGRFFFDENLTMLMDCEMYYKLFKEYGTPTIINECLVTNRIHQNQISSKFKGDINNEIDYVKNKYNL